MIAGARAALVALVAACGTPTPSLVLQYSAGPSQKCQSTECAGVAMMCDAVMSIRIIDPSDPTAPWLSQCVSVAHQKPQNNMCALNSVELADTPIPVRDLEVQIAVYPASDIPSGACPTKVNYSDATGFPVEQVPTPVLGGRAYYHPGDDVVSVTLGCTDVEALNASCAVSSAIPVTATVDAFPDETSVTGAVASRLTVSIGEPRLVDADGTYALRAADSRMLDAVASGGTTPSWAAEVTLPLTRYACIDAVEGVAQTTASLRCRLATAAARLDLSGAWIAKDTLQAIVNALSVSTTPMPFPDDGLTIGIVVDSSSVPVSGLVVTATAGTVQYLADPTKLGGSATSAAGLFVSRDAPFGTVFSTTGPGRAAVSAIGGRVQGKLTIVVLRFGGPPP